MPNYTPVPAEYAQKIAAAGEDPANYVFDADSLQAIHKEDLTADAPQPQQKEGSFKPTEAFIQGFVRDALASPTKYVGEMIKQAPGWAGGGEVTEADKAAAQLGMGLGPGTIRSTSSTLRDLGEAGNRFADKYNLNPEDAGLLRNQLMRATGNLAGTLLPAGVAGKTVQGIAAAPKVVSGVASALGALQGGEQARQLAVDSGKSEGEAALRSLPAAAVSFLIDKFLQSGRIGGMIAGGGENLAKEGLLKTALKETGIGAAGGAAQQAVTDVSATGSTSAENLGNAALVSGLFQGAVGTGIKAGFDKVGGPPPGTVKLGQGDALAQVHALLGKPADAAADVAKPPILESRPQLSDAEISTYMAMSAEAIDKMPAKTHSHKALAAAKESNVRLTPERIDRLFKTADKVEADKLVNAMYMEDQMAAAARPKSAEESAMAMTERLKPVLEKYNKDFETITKTREELQALVENIDKAPAMNAGQKWQAKNNTIVGYTKQIEQLERALLAKLQGENPDVVQTLMRGVPAPTQPKQNIPMEGEQRAPFAAEAAPTIPKDSPVSVGTVQRPPVADPAPVVAAQIKAAADPASPRAVVLGADKAPQGLISIKSPAGPAVVNPAKVDPAAAAAGLSREVADPKLFGMSGAAGERPVGETVVTADKGPLKNIQAEVVNNPAQIPAAAEAAAKAVPGGEVKVKSAEQVKQERIEADQIVRQRELDAAMAEAQGMSLEDYDKTYNFGIPVKRILKSLGVTDGAEYVATLSRGVAAREASRSAGGAAMRDTWNTMTNDRNRMLNKNIMIANKLKPWLEDPRITAWANRGVETKTWDMTGLPAEFHAPAATIKQWLESFADEQLLRKIGVREFINGQVITRPITKVPGYFPFNVDKSVFDAQNKNSAAWAGLKKDFMDNWAAHYGTSPAAMAEAQAALNDMFSPFGGGVNEPLYSAVRKAHGIPLPASWRSKNLYQSMVHYARRHAVDMAWGTHVQYSPVQRKFWGIAEDPMGVKHQDPDMMTANSPELAAAVREGERIDADWLKRGDMSIGNVTAGDGSAEALIASFTGRPVGGVSKSQKFFESAQTVAGSILMQTRAAVRNASQMAFSLPEYVSIREIGPAVKGAIDTVMSPIASIEAAKLGGAMPDSPLVHEAANVVYDAAYKTANGLRKLTGYNFVEEFSRAFVWNVVKNTVEYHQAKGVDSPLAKEFGPATGNIAEETANNLVNRILPTYDARTLPASMTPQMKSTLNNLAGLMRFGVARYNNWYEDVIKPAQRGNYGRLMKSLFFGTAGSVATSGLLSYVTGSKPSHLTLVEWLGLDDKKKLEEVAPMLFAYNQMQGTMGIAGDVASYGVNLMTGKPMQMFDASPRTSAVIIGTDMVALLSNFGAYVGENGLSAPAVMQLGLELGRLNDSWRAVEGAIGSEDSIARQDRRAIRLYEQLEGKSAKTGEPLVPKLFSVIPPRQPFSLGKDLNRAETPADYLNLVGPLSRRMAAGIEPPKVDNPMKTDEFYTKMIGLQGDDARRRLKKDLEELPKVEDRRAFREAFRP